MKIIKNKIVGNQLVNVDTKIYGIIVGSVKVIDCLYHIYGIIDGNLEIEKGAIVNLYGTVQGHVINNGGVLNVHGTIFGNLIKSAGTTNVDSNAVIQNKIINK